MASTFVPLLFSVELCDISPLEYTKFRTKSEHREQETHRKYRLKIQSTVWVTGTVQFLITQPLAAVGGGCINKFGCGKPSNKLSRASLTKFHEQGQQDPQRDLEGLPDVVVVEGEDGESLFVSGGVTPVMGVLIRHHGWISPRPVVVSRNIISTGGGGGDEREQQNAR